MAQNYREWKRKIVLQWLEHVILDIKKKLFSGTITINFFKGGVTNIHKEERIDGQVEGEKEILFPPRGEIRGEHY